MGKKLKSLVELLNLHNFGPGGSVVVIRTPVGPNSNLLGSTHHWYQQQMLCGVKIKLAKEVGMFVLYIHGWARLS